MYKFTHIITRFTTKNISIGEELFFDYGDKFLTKWLTDFNKLCDDYYKKWLLINKYKK